MGGKYDYRRYFKCAKSYHFASFFVGQNQTIRDIASAALTISREGLNARNCLNAHGENETVFLQTLDEFVKTGKTNADLLIEKFKGEWDGNILRAYEDCRY